MSKKVAIFIDSLNGGGAEKVVITLAESLLQLGHQVTLFVLHKRIDYQIADSLPVYFLNDDPKQKTKGWFNRSKLAKKLRTLVEKVQIEQGRFDLFLVNLEESYRIVSACDFAPCFYVVHNSLKETLARTKKLGPLKYLYVKRQLAYLDGKDLIAVSNGVEQELQQLPWLKPATTCTIYNPFNISQIRRLAEASDTNIPKEKFVIHIGRFAKQKRHDLLLMAFNSVANQYKLVCLCSNAKKLSKQVEKLGLSERVIIPGFNQNPYNWIKQAELLVLSSDYEGFGNVLVEAIICGTPVVSVDCPHGPNEIMTDELADYLVERRNADALATKINQALDLQPDVSNAAIVAKVEAEQVAQQYIALLKN